MMAAMGLRLEDGEVAAIAVSSCPRRFDLGDAIVLAACVRVGRVAAAGQQLRFDLCTPRILDLSEPPLRDWQAELGGPDGLVAEAAWTAWWGLTGRQLKREQLVAKIAARVYVLLPTPALPCDLKPSRSRRGFPAQQ